MTAEIKENLRGLKYWNVSMTLWLFTSIYSLVKSKQSLNPRLWNMADKRSVRWIAKWPWLLYSARLRGIKSLCVSELQCIKVKVWECFKEFIPQTIHSRPHYKTLQPQEMWLIFFFLPCGCVSDDHIAGCVTSWVLFKYSYIRSYKVWKYELLHFCLRFCH